MNFRKDVVMSREELKSMSEQLGFRPPIAQFEMADVPATLLKFVPYAELWGHNADDVRYEVVESTPHWLKEHVRTIVLEPDVQDLFDEWLAGPEARGPKFTPAYLAFTTLRMAAHEMD